MPDELKLQLEIHIIINKYCYDLAPAEVLQMEVSTIPHKHTSQNLQKVHLRH